jgi:hypothetical protein
MPKRKLVKKLSPEEKELQRKKKELAALEDQLAQVELDLNTLQTDVGAFLYSIQAAVGEKILEEALLRARLTEALLAIEPSNREYEAQAKKARKDAEKSKQEHDAFAGRSGTSGTYVEFESKRKVRASDEVRKLYLKLVKLAHPDLTTNSEEKERRTRSMQEVNAAYADGDQERLEQLHRQWHAPSESTDGGEVGAELVRVIRQINQVKQRIAAAQTELSGLMRAGDYEMFLEAQEQGFEDYLNGLTAAADIEINRLKAATEELSGRIKEMLDT